MSDERSVDEMDRDLAAAFGLYALTDATLQEAARAADVTSLELEVAIEQAGLENVFELDAEREVSETIDELLDGH